MKNGTWRTLGKAVSVISIAALSLGTLAACGDSGKGSTATRVVCTT